VLRLIPDGCTSMPSFTSCSGKTGINASLLLVTLTHYRYIPARFSTTCHPSDTHTVFMYPTGSSQRC
jgi:hypothetical protein